MPLLLLASTPLSLVPEEVPPQSRGAVQARNPRGSETEKLEVSQRETSLFCRRNGYGVRSQLPREKEDSRVIRPARKTPAFSNHFIVTTVIRRDGGEMSE